MKKKEKPFVFLLKHVSGEREKEEKTPKPGFFFHNNIKSSLHTPAVGHSLPVTPRPTQDGGRKRKRKKDG